MTHSTREDKNSLDSSNPLKYIQEDNIDLMETIGFDGNIDGDVYYVQTKNDEQRVLKGNLYKSMYPFEKIIHKTYKEQLCTNITMKHVKLVREVFK